MRVGVLAMGSLGALAVASGHEATRVVDFDYREHVVRACGGDFDVFVLVALAPGALYFWRPHATHLVRWRLWMARWLVLAGALAVVGPWRRSREPIELVSPLWPRVAIPALLGAILVAESRLLSRARRALESRPVPPRAQIPRRHL